MHLVASVITSEPPRTSRSDGRKKPVVSGERLALGPFRRVSAFILKAEMVMARGSHIDV